MNRKTADSYHKRKRLQRYGFDADPRDVRVHRDETPEHVTARRLCGYVLQQADRSWAEEVETPNGRIDVVDFGDFDEEPLAIEFESVPDQPTIDDKLRKYVENGPCRDLIMFDLRECPETVGEIPEWIRGGLAGV